MNSGVYGGAVPEVDASDSIELADGAPRQTSTRYARDFIREAIVSGQFREGQALSQVRLALELGVSRTPLREAIRMLEAEGWLESEPNRRVRVARVSLTELEQLYAMRISLESLAVSVSALRLGERELERAREILVGARELLQRDAYDEWEHANRDFHSLLMAPAGRSVLQSCQGLIDSCWRYRKIYVLAQPAAFVNADAEHARILDACEARDPAEAAAAVANHLARTALTLIAAADPAYDPAVIRTAMSVGSRPSTRPGQWRDGAAVESEAR